MRFRRRLAPAFVMLPVLVLSARGASADSETCAKAYETSQSKRGESKLLDARRDLVMCAQDACPAVVRRDCVSWLSEVEQEIPTIAVKVRVDGCDRPDARVTLDGAPVNTEGRSVEVDPGTHVVKASVPGQTPPTQEQRVIVAAKEKHRVVTLTFGTKQLCGPDGKEPASSSPGRQPSSDHGDTQQQQQQPKPVPMLTWVLGGVGIAGLGVTTGLGIVAFNQKSDLDLCKDTNNCTPDRVDTMQRTFLAADIVGLVSLAALAAATIVYLTR